MQEIRSGAVPAAICAGMLSQKSESLGYCMNSTFTPVAASTPSTAASSLFCSSSAQTPMVTVSPSDSPCLASTTAVVSLVFSADSTGASLWAPVFPHAVRQSIVAAIDNAITFFKMDFFIVSLPFSWVLNCTSLVSLIIGVRTLQKNQTNF